MTLTSSAPRPQMYLRQGPRVQRHGLGSDQRNRMLVEGPAITLRLLRQLAATGGSQHSSGAWRSTQRRAHPSATVPEKGGWVQLYPGPSGAGTTSMWLMALQASQDRQRERPCAASPCLPHPAGRSEAHRTGRSSGLLPCQVNRMEYSLTCGAWGSGAGVGRADPSHGHLS